MPTYPNTGQAHSGTYVWGSAKVEYSSNGSSWNNLGVARNVVFKENITKAMVQSDNSPNIIDRIGDQTVDVSFTLLELYLPALDAIRGIDAISVTSADATTDTDVHTTGEWAKGDIIWLENQGATDTLPSISAVQSVDTNNSCDTYESTADYTVITDSNTVPPYRRGIQLTPAANGGGYNDTEALMIKYVYGAINARKLTSGGYTDLTQLYYRLTNAEVVSGTTKYRYFTVYSASISDGLNLAFKSSNESDSLLEIPISLTAIIDTDRSVGDQLFAVEDQRGTA